MGMMNYTLHLGIEDGALPEGLEMGARLPGSRCGSGATGADWRLPSQSARAGRLRDSHKSRLPGPVLDCSAQLGRTIGEFRTDLFSEAAVRPLDCLLLEFAGEPHATSRTTARNEQTPKVFQLRWNRH